MYHVRRWKWGSVALIIAAVAVISTALATSGMVVNVCASDLSNVLAKTTTTANTTVSTPVTTTVTKTVTETVTATKTFYSVITYTLTTAKMIEYYGTKTFILLFVIMALTVALGFSLRRYKKLVSSTQ